MKHSTHKTRTMSAAALAVGILAAGVGCSSTKTSHIVEPAAPAVSPNAVASAEPGVVARPFSLVAADAIGMATFGDEVARDRAPESEADHISDR